MKSLLVDLLFLSLISALSFFLISFYLPAQNINVTYPDWMVQAFRVKELELHGLTSWTHTWSNGINLWKSYQLIPHVITLGVAKLFHLEITRAMVILVITQFILLRILTYVVARLLKFSPFTALVASLMTFSIAYFWKAVGDYTLLFALSFFPLIILLWVKYLEGKIQFIFPYIAGLLFYIHPLLGLTAISLWCFTKFFEGVKVFSWKTFFQFATFLVASAFFWVPIVFRDSYTNSTIYIATKEFMQLTLAPFPYFGLSFCIFICFFIAFFQQFFPISSRYRWVKILVLYVFLYFTLIYTGVHLSLPTFINQFQYTRGVGFLGIAIIFSVLPFVETIQKTNTLAIRGILVAAITVALAEGIWITSNYSPSIQNITIDPVTNFVMNKKIDDTTDRIWTPTIELSSFYGSVYALHFPISYMAHLESNHLPERLNQLITYRPFLNQIPLSELTRINNYFQLAGTKYVFLDESSSFVQVLKDKNSGYRYLEREITPNGVYEVFEAPWIVRNATLIANVYKNDLTSFPTDMKFNEVADQVRLDTKVKTFSEMLYSPLNERLDVAYPTEESILVSLPTKRSTPFVLVNESYDKQWKAYFKNTKLSISPVGPNFMLIHVNNLDDGGTISLIHSWPLYYYFILFAIPIVPLSLFFIPRIMSKN